MTEGSEREHRIWEWKAESTLARALSFFFDSLTVYSLFSPKRNKQDKFWSLPFFRLRTSVIIICLSLTVYSHDWFIYECLVHLIVRWCCIILFVKVNCHHHLLFQRHLIKAQVVVRSENELCYVYQLNNILGWTFKERFDIICCSKYECIVTLEYQSYLLAIKP